MACYSSGSTEKYIRNVGSERHTVLTAKRRKNIKVKKKITMVIRVSSEQKELGQVGFTGNGKIQYF